ncbi:MAG: tyrosine-type recombinase/integrase [Candidatus Korobacteraceae bacterium]
MRAMWPIDIERATRGMAFIPLLREVGESAFVKVDAIIQHPHERAMKKAGLTAFPFYCWRHTFGTRCAESGMDRFSLARLMGHSSPRVTERYYIHVTESHVANGLEKFVAYQAEKRSSWLPVHKRPTAESSIGAWTRIAKADDRCTRCGVVPPIDESQPGVTIGVTVRPE